MKSALIIAFALLLLLTNANASARDDDGPIPASVDIQSSEHHSIDHGASKSHSNKDQLMWPSNKVNKPTHSPTKWPTKKPTSTDKPTKRPTRKPTPWPTSKATRKPTHSPPRPTDKQTKRATRKPTHSPTMWRTPEPTRYPTTMKPRDDSESDSSSDHKVEINVYWGQDHWEHRGSYKWNNDDVQMYQRDEDGKKERYVEHNIYVENQDLTQEPSADPNPTDFDQPCGDARKEWNISFSCPGTPQFELVTSCPGGYAVQISLDKIFEVNTDRRGTGNEVVKWGKRGTRKSDLVFMWDGGNSEGSGTLMTVDGEERDVVINRFSARVSKKLKGDEDAWLNITVLFFEDPRGGVFDLLNSGNPSDYTAVERNTLKYLVDATNWPLKQKADLLAMRFTYALKEISDPTLTQCAYDGRSKGKKGSKGDTEGWECNEDKRSDTNPDGWGPYDEPCLTFTSGDAADTCRNYAFGIDFRLESNTVAMVDQVREEMEEPLLEGVEWGGVQMTHYFPVFQSLQWDGASLFYLPTFDYYSNRDITQ